MLANLHEVLPEGDRVADPDPLLYRLRREAEIDKQIPQLEWLLPLFLGQNVDRLAAYAPHQVAGLGVDDHALRHQRHGIEAAGGVDAKEAGFLFDVTDEEADLVHVSGNRDDGALALLVGNQIPECVNLDRIDVALQRSLHKRPNRCFVAGDARRFAQSLQ